MPSTFKTKFWLSLPAQVEEVTFEVLPVLHDHGLDEDGDGGKVVLDQLHPVLRVEHLEAADLGHHIHGRQRPDHVPLDVDVVRNLGVVIDAPEAVNVSSQQFAAQSKVRSVALQQVGEGAPGALQAPGAKCTT